jgi:hypothetical protein
MNLFKHGGVEESHTWGVIYVPDRKKELPLVIESLNEIDAVLIEMEQPLTDGEALELSNKKNNELTRKDGLNTKGHYLPFKLHPEMMQQN